MTNEVGMPSGLNTPLPVEDSKASFKHSQIGLTVRYDEPSSIVRSFSLRNGLDSIVSTSAMKSSFPESTSKLTFYIHCTLKLTLINTKFIFLILLIKTL